MAFKTKNANLNSIRNKNAKLLFNPFREDEENVQNELAIDKYGFNPVSVWHIKKSKKLVQFVNDTIGNGSFIDRGKNSKKGEKELSLFNPDVVYRIIKYYTKKGDVIVAPYGSRGVIGLTAYLLGRHSYSCDVVDSYVENMKERFEQARSEINDDDTTAEFFVCDAVTAKVRATKLMTPKAWEVVDRKTKQMKSEFADCVIFNPPYYNLEQYKSVDGQMSDIESYDDFLVEYGKAIEQHFRICKENGFCIAVVNDFRQDGKFYDFHNDTIQLAKKAGFLMHDIIINELNGRSLQAIGSFEKIGLKIMAKLHEYIIVFRKPSTKGEDYRCKWGYVETKKTKERKLKEARAKEKKRIDKEKNELKKITTNRKNKPSAKLF